MSPTPGGFFVSLLLCVHSSQPEDPQQTAPQPGPEFSHLFLRALGGGFLAKKHALPLEEVVEQRVHPAKICPKGLGPHGTVREPRGEADRGILIGPPRG